MVGNFVKSKNMSPHHHDSFTDIKNQFESKKTNLTGRELAKEIEILEQKPNKTKTEIFLFAMLKLQQVNAAVRSFPKSKESWLNFQLGLVKTKRAIIGAPTNLSDKHMKKVITHVRSLNAKRSEFEPSPFDPDLPTCFFWTSQNVSEWLRTEGYPHLEEMFERNFICGRRLINVDACALSKMGLKYFKEIQTLSTKIREILKIHRPNMMRALLRRVPFEHYLQLRQKTGNSYNNTTFERFCEANGYPYAFLSSNPLALIECSCELVVNFGGQNEENSSSTNESSESSNTVSSSFSPYQMLVRDKVVGELIDELLELVLESRSEGDMDSEGLRRILLQGFESLGISASEFEKRFAFGRLVAEEMLREARRTQEVLQDLDKFRTYVQFKKVDEKQLVAMREVASEFFDTAANIGTLLALRELELDAIFREEPHVQKFVDEIIEEAEERTRKIIEGEKNNEKMNGIVGEMREKISREKFPFLSPETAEALKEIASSNLEEIVSGAAQFSNFMTQPAIVISDDLNNTNGLSSKNPEKLKDISQTIGFFTVHYNDFNYLRRNYFDKSYLLSSEDKNNNSLNWESRREVESNSKVVQKVVNMIENEKKYLGKNNSFNEGNLRSNSIAQNQNNQLAHVHKNEDIQKASDQLTREIIRESLFALLENSTSDEEISNILKTISEST